MSEPSFCPYCRATVGCNCCRVWTAESSRGLNDRTHDRPYTPPTQITVRVEYDYGWFRAGRHFGLVATPEETR